MNWSARGNVLNQYLRNTSIGTTVKKLPTTSNFKRQYKVDLLSNQINNP
jgi:hypothetical protein